MLPLLIPILTAVLPSLVPALVKKALPSVIIKAEELTVDGEPLTGPQKKLWVESCFLEIYGILRSRDLVSAKYDAAFGAFIPFLSAEIEKQLAKLKAKGRV